MINHTPHLRPYQEKSIEAIYHAWINHKSVLFQMPTGTGKTTVFAEIVRQEVNKEKKVLIVAHRQEIIYQIQERLSHFGLDSGIIMSNHLEDRSRPIQIASISTLNRREHPSAQLVVIDEAHHSTALSYRKLWEIYAENEKFLGVTATPIRLSGEPFEDFDYLITSPPIKWFIKNGYLSQYKYYVSSVPNVSNVKIRGSDYAEEELSVVMRDMKIMADLIESYKKYALNKKTIIFAVDIQHSQFIIERFKQEGFDAEHLDGKTPYEERKKIISRFRNGNIKILSNVGIINEGFDLPDCDAVQLARPTKSLTLYLQQVGRCLRPHYDKNHAIILDNAGCWIEHGLPSIDREWSLLGVSVGNDSHDIRSIDEYGGIKKIKNPTECKGFELKLLEEIETMNALELENTINRLRSEIVEKEHGMLNLPKEYHDILLRGLRDLKNELQSYESQLDLIKRREVDKRLDMAKEKLQSVVNHFINTYEFHNDKEKKMFIDKINLKKNDGNVIFVFQNFPIRNTSSARNGQRKSKITGFYFLGQHFLETKGDRLLEKSLNKFIENYPTKVIRVFQEIHNERIDTRRRVFAESIEELYDESVSDEVKNSARKLRNGWWVDTNNSTQQKIDLLKEIAKRIGLRYGEDYKVGIKEHA